MVDITSGIAEDLAVDVVLVAEGKNIDIPLRQSLHAFFFGNPLPDIWQDASVFFNILDRKEPLTRDPRFPHPYSKFHHLTPCLHPVPSFSPPFALCAGHESREACQFCLP